MTDISIGWLHARAIEGYYRRHPEQVPKRRNTQPRSYTGVIYKYTNRVNGKVYIGQTIREKARKSQHKNIDKFHENSVFHKAIKKYGWESFDYVVLYKKHYLTIEDAEFDLNLWEVYYIGLYGALKHGYNCNIGGGSNKGHKQSKETVQRIVEATKKPVLQINPKSGEIIREWKGTVDAARALGISPDAINSVTRRRKHTAAGYVWRKTDDYDPNENLIVIPRERLVIQKDLEGNVIREWDTIAEAARGTQGEANSIINVCQGKFFSSGGFRWCYKDAPELAERFQPKDPNYFGRPVIQMTLNGEFVKEWPRIKDAANSLNLHYNSIRNVCKGQMLSVGGFRWCYKDAPELVRTERLKGNQRPVMQFSMEGEFIQEYRNMKEAERVTGILSSCIGQVALRRSQCAGGYLWRFSDDYTPDEIVKYEAPSNANRGVCQYSLSGQLISRFESLSQAARETECISSDICCCCKGKKKTAGGYIWKYTDDDTPIAPQPIPFRKRVVLQFDVNRQLIREWESATEAAKELGLNPKTIIRCCNGRQISTGGYIWSYADEKGKINALIIPSRKKPVLQFDLNGNLIKEWPSATDAGKALGFSNTLISNCCRGGKTSMGFKWRFKEQ